MHLIIWLLSLLQTVAFLGGEFPFFSSKPLRTSPSEELRCLYVDHYGMLWMSTDAGLKFYDGYSVNPFTVPSGEEESLPNNIILSITEDGNDGLWAGTMDGLVRLDRPSGKMRVYSLSDSGQSSVYTLFTASDGTVWIGTDQGLTRYVAAEDAFLTYGPDNAWVETAEGRKERLHPFSVKSIVEAPDGSLFIGTWSSGLFRFNPDQETFLAYPSFNKADSAFSLMLDSRSRLWIGTWGQGLYLLENPFDEVSQARVKCILPAQDNPRNFTRIVEDHGAGMVWAGDIDGVCLFDPARPEAGFRTFRPTGDIYPEPLRYCSDIVADRWGNVWLGMLHEGVFHIRTQPTPFRYVPIRAAGTQEAGGHSVSRLFTDDGTHVWMGLLPFGIALHDRKTGQVWMNDGIPGFSRIPEDVFRAAVSSIIRSPDGRIWIATRGGGIIATDGQHEAELLTADTCDFLTENYITALYSDTDGYAWVGQRSGIGLYGPGGAGGRLPLRIDGEDPSRCHVKGIFRDREGIYWISTEDQGILRLEGQPWVSGSFQCIRYDNRSGNYAFREATACLEDREGRMWAISNWGGLFLLDRDNNRFERMDHGLHIPGGRILSILEGTDGSLWLTVDDAVVRLQNPSLRDATTRWYSEDDGLGEAQFSSNASFRFAGELFFGSKDGYLVYTEGTQEGDGRPLELTVTDFAVDGIPYGALAPDVRVSVSARTPMYTRQITLPASARELSLDFSLLSHAWPGKNRYAYLMEGYDRDWRYPADGHRATYQNMPSGTYSFRLKASGPDGRLEEMGYPVTVRILPHWYETWWAKILSGFLLAGFILSIIYLYGQRVKTKQHLRMNHVLTNLTHELLTPLAVISCAAEQMKRGDVRRSEDYGIIESNIDRITRHLRQILEVRKADAGELRLRVSRGNLGAFVQQECRSIGPMTYREGLRLQVQVPEKGPEAWFDPDKLDKILYNLLSNAIKYNREGGFVEVTLEEDGEVAVLTVRDGGMGISRARMKHLYDRFTDGDYRRKNVTGTGLGLSLTHELVKLHHGTIACESREGEGATFTVRLPIRETAYTAEETDRSAPAEAAEMPAASETASSDRTGYTLLVVEDDRELLDLMGRYFSSSYRVLKARNGEQAVELIRKKDPDLVVSDVVMPRMDGLALTRWIKESETHAQLPVILLTARTREEDRLSGFRTGADDYVTKPFRMEELQVRVDAVLRNRERVRKRFIGQSALPVEDLHYSSAFLQRAAGCIVEHLSDGAYDRESFARDMYMSSSSLYNKIRAATGQNITGFINSIRLKEACRIAENQPDISITELAEHVGYNSARYFTMCFKKEYGLPPKEYLERFRPKEDSSPSAAL